MEILKKYLPVFTGVIVFIVYLTTIAPSVIQIDAGELAAVQALPGVAHPTGYPLFTFLGYLFSLLPLPFTKIFQLNLLAAIYTASAVAVFVASFTIIIENLGAFRKAKKQPKAVIKTRKTKKVTEVKAAESTVEVNIFENYPLLKIIVPAASGLFLAFIKTVWFQSTGVEVYSLHLLLIITTLFFLLKGYIHTVNSKGELNKYWIYFAISLGLSFSNHMTTLLILPATAYLFFSAFGFRKESFKIIGKMLAVFFPVLIINYALLMYLASTNPMLNWGNIHNFENFWRHFTGKQYSIWLFSSFDAAKGQFEKFITNLPIELTLTMIFSVGGFFLIIKRYFKLGVFIAILFLFTVIYSINYDIVDSETYYLLGYVAAAISAGFGLMFLAELIRKEELVLAVIVPVIILVNTAQIYINYHSVNQSGNMIFENYTRAVLDVADPNSMIMTYQWDYFASPAYYFQYVENYRKDVIIVEKELVRRSWYHNQLGSIYPEYTSKLKNETDLFLNLVKPFELELPFDAARLETSFRNLLQAYIRVALEEGRSVYIGIEVLENELKSGEITLPLGAFIIPDVLFLRVVNEDRYYPAKDPVFEIKNQKQDNYYTRNIEFFVASNLLKRALYEAQYQKPDRMKIYRDKLLKDYPGFPIPEDAKKVLDIK
ncbi:MAG: DUF2723 domain-containing protein [Ignavibacteriaceae bacterium]|nr:DUF2723 domain-containing protein [Ignavibacteriaceae bacterium]